MMFFRSGSEAERMAVIEEVERETRQRREAVEVTVVSGQVNITEHVGHVWCWVQQPQYLSLLHSNPLRLRTFSFLHVPRLGTSHFLPRHRHHRSTSLACGKYNTKIVSRSG